MVNYEIKYKKQQSNIVCSILWGIASLISTIILIFIINVHGLELPLNIGFIYVVVIFLFNAILSFSLAKFYITLSSRAYIKIYDKELEIHKGMLRKNQFIKFEDIEEVRLIGNKMYILLNEYVSLKEVEIFLDVIYMKDLDRLLLDLSEGKILVKKESVTTTMKG